MAEVKFSELPLAGSLVGDEVLVGLKPSGSESDEENVLITVEDLTQHVLNQDSGAGGGGASDAADLTYTPTTPADWDGGADPGDGQEAFDQLAERVKDLEGGGGGSGKLIQVLNTQTGAVATTTTTIPADDTIPQNSEGAEFMTLAITPTSATNKLRIDVSLELAFSTNNAWLTAALFQDSTANALAARTAFQVTGGGGVSITYTHYMTAGTTSATTFKVRGGSNVAGTVTFNGALGARLFGGVMASSITITEIVP